MVFSQNLLLEILQVVFTIFPLLVQAQEKTGFISIDCGLSDVTSYTDETTGINYVSDANFTEFGENRVISPTHKTQTDDEQQLWNVRSFPQGIRNCYTLRPSQRQGTRYLIRARFMYGNYDKLEHPPEFDLHIGVDPWDTVDLKDSVKIVNKEIMYTPLSPLIHVCLVNTGFGVPFISALELRPLRNEIYQSEKNARSSLNLWGQYDMSSATDKRTRYKDDLYDRLWFPNDFNPFIKASASDENSISKNDFSIPGAVMGTAYTRNTSSRYMNIYWDEMNTSTVFFMYMHFSELEILQANQSREFDIFINGDLWSEKVVPRHLKVDTYYSTIGFSPDKDGTIDIWLNNTKTATLPPLINAMELFMLKDLSGKDTNQADVEAILGVKSTYGLKRIKWQGDPCGHEDYVWDGLKCSYTDDKLSRIVSLNLSSSELKGEVSPSIGNLELLEELDLSNNNLTGEVPEFLLHLSFLKVLNLKGNNFTGFPGALLSKKGLQISIDVYPESSPPCSSGSCSNKKGFVVPLVASLGAVLFAIFITVAVICIFKKRKIQQSGTDVRVVTATETPTPRDEDDTFGSKKQQFTYSELEKITRNFKRVLGEGGFGKVYHGYLNGNQVAVKMLSSPSIQGHRQFNAELKLLLRVHHKNLTTLVGYCDEPTNVGLIYEYMAMGNLRSHLSGGRRSFLSWQDRLRIAVDTAQGLEYLHNGCKPPIIHRDVKSTNILLNEKFQAKLGDFGLSKIFPLEDGNRTSTFSTPGMTTSIAGSPGYLDPEYYSTNWLNEKSDVYSFGIVLLELITARPVLTETQPNSHIIRWVSSMVETGDINNILDPRLRGGCDINTAWKAIEISISCVSKTSIDRPTMSGVTTELKECLKSELTRKESRDVASFSNDSSVEMMSRTMISEFSPEAR